MKKHVKKPKLYFFFKRRLIALRNQNGLSKLSSDLSNSTNFVVMFIDSSFLTNLKIGGLSEYCLMVPQAKP